MCREQLFVKKETQLTPSTVERKAAALWEVVKHMEERTPKVQERKRTVTHEITIKSDELSPQAHRRQEVQKWFLSLRHRTDLIWTSDKGAAET